MKRGGTEGERRGRRCSDSDTGELSGYGPVVIHLTISSVVGRERKERREGREREERRERREKREKREKRERRRRRRFY